MQKRGLAIGAWSGISGLGVALGPVVGGAVVDGISWHWIFWLNVPTGLILVPLSRRFLTESHGPADKLDLPGIGLAGLGLLGVVFGIVRGEALGWTAAPIIASLALGAALLVSFVVWEHRARRRCCRCASSRAARSQRDQRDVAGDVLRRLRLDLPAVAVLPDDAGAHTAAGRAAGAAVDDHADVRGAGRGHPQRRDWGAGR